VQHGVHELLRDSRGSETSSSESGGGRRPGEVDDVSSIRFIELCATLSELGEGLCMLLKHLLMVFVELFLWGAIFHEMSQHISVLEHTTAFDDLRERQTQRGGNEQRTTLSVSRLTCSTACLRNWTSTQADFSDSWSSIILNSAFSLCFEANLRALS
jgi:hypothetical protein